MKTITSNRLSMGFIALGLAVSLGACGDKKGANGGKEGEAKADAGHPVYGKEDLAARGKALEGKFTAKLNAQSIVNVEGMRKLFEPMVFEVKDGKASITAEKGEKATARLTVTSPCEASLEVEGKEGKLGFSFAVNGKDAYLGAGDAGVKLADGRWLICAGMGGLITFDGKSDCKHFKKDRMSRKANAYKETKVTCAVEGDTLKYQVPKFMKDGEFDDKTAKIVGDAILSDQMVSDHKIAR